LQPDAGNAESPSGVGTDVLKKAAISYGIRQVVITGLGLGSNIVLTRILMPQEYGVIAIIMMVVALGTILADGGLGVYLIQRKDEIDDRDLSGIVNIQLVASLSLVTVICSVALVNQLFFERNQVYWLLAVSSTSIPFTVVRGMALLRLERMVKMNKIAIVDVLEQCLYTTTAVALAYYGAGAWSIVDGLVVKSVAGCVIALFLAPWAYRCVFPALTSEFKSGIRFALHFQGAQLVNIARGAITPLFINSALGFRNGGFVERAAFINSTPTGLVSIIQNKVFFPFSARIQEDRQRLLKFLEDSIYGNSILDKIFYLPLLLFTRETILIVFTAKWLPITDLLQLLMSSTILLGALASPLYPVINAIGASQLIFRFNLATMIASWLFMVPLCLMFGINGVGITIWILWIGIFWLKRELQKLIGEFEFYRSIYKPTVAAVAAYLLIAVLKGQFGLTPVSVIQLLIAYVLTIAVFVVTLFLIDMKRIAGLVGQVLRP
jgi:O-antigen/teichoic acid export membrane protein